MAQNAVDMIKADHRKVEQLYQQFQQGQGTQKQQLAEQICQELTIHAQLEESIFYPAVQQKLGSQGSSLVQEALKEHGEMKQKIRQMQSGRGNGSNVDGMVSQLMSDVQHHVREEESQMLPQAQQQLGNQLDQLGMQMQQQKQQLMSATGNQAQSSGGTTSRGTNPGTRSSSQSDKPMHD